MDKITIRDMKHFQGDLGFYNREMASLLGVSLATYKSWVHRRHLPVYVQNHIDVLKRLYDSDYVEFINLKLERGLTNVSNR